MATPPPPANPPQKCEGCYDVVAGMQSFTGDIICTECVRDMFQYAMDREHSWPVKWGRQEMHPRDFAVLFDEKYFAAYEAREAEYKTSALRRVYCNGTGGCGKFVGAKMLSALLEGTGIQVFQVCECKARWCLQCGGEYAETHTCRPAEELERERRAMTEHLVRGKDYQICPGQDCKRIIELSEACNHMHCRCGEDFCYLCGERAKEGSDHWREREGGCPKYGGKDSGRFEVDEAVDDGGEDEAEEVIEQRTPWDGLNILEPWERGERRLTTWNFERFTWMILWAHGTSQPAMETILRGEDNAPIDMIERLMNRLPPNHRDDIDDIHWVSEVNSVVQWHTTINWLTRMWQVSRTGGDLLTFFGGPMVPIWRGPRIVNVANAADLQAGTEWLHSTNATYRTREEVERFLDENHVPSVIFDVGPDDVTVRPPVTYNIRDMDIFDGLENMRFYRLAGNALLVLAQPGWVDPPVDNGAVVAPQAEAAA
ncbi:hypothetical protein Q7P37_002355 [Cladosporium fusiforme]